MSAIWGIISFHHEIAPSAADIMRKPYEEKCKLQRISVLEKQNLLMGCGIQYITPESRFEELPCLHQQKNFYFDADCLLDNREELLQVLSPELSVSGSSMPDGTLLYQAYAKWGIECVHHLRGLFSFAIYEPAKQTLYLVADQLSSRCLYYYRREDSVIFSTLLEPITSLCPEIRHNELFIKDFLTAPGLMPNMIPADTPYQDVYKLNPGTYLECTPEGITEHRYWHPQSTPAPCTFRTAAEYGAYFRTLYEDCVRDALRTDGEIGVSFSSGLDSATVGTLAAKQLQEEGKDLYTYTYVPSEEAPRDRNRNNVLNEEKDALSITEHYPNMLPHFLNNHGKNCLEDLELGLNIMEVPFKAFINLPNLCEIYRTASSDGCKVLLSGQSGNSTVSHGYIDDVLYDLYSTHHYVTFLKYLNRYSLTVKESRKDALRGCYRYFQFATKTYRNPQFTYTPDNPFLTSAILDDYPLRERFLAGGTKFTEQLPLPRWLYQEMLYRQSFLTYIGELETKMGLYHGIIIRDPTKDIRMMSFCYHLPYHLFAYQGTPRWLIRGNLQDLLPASLLDNWMRYGVQNSDWFVRIIRDWKRLQPEVMNTLHDSLISPYLDTEKITCFFNDAGDCPTLKDQDTFLYLCFVYVTEKYLGGPY